MMQLRKAFLITIVLIALFNQPSLIFLPSEEFRTQGCTTIIAMGNATLDGSVLLAKNRDLSEFELQWLYYSPREHYPAGSKVKLQCIEIPQVSTTWAWIGSKSYTEKWGIGMGINEWGLAIADNNASTREPLEGEKGLHDNDICRLILERTKNPVDAAQLIGELITTYGHSFDGQIYSLANSTEAWIVEAAGKHWAAVKVKKLEVRANQFQITTDWDLGSEDLIEYAIKQGWYKSEKEFNFARCYSPEDYPFAYSQQRVERGLELLEPKLGKLCPQDLIKVLRDHYEDTKKYWYPPHENPNYRTICAKRTCASMVCQLRPWLPRQLQLMWYSMCSPCESIFVPIYAGTTEILEPWRSGMGGEDWSNYTADSTWWRFKQLQYLVDKNYKDYQPIIRESWEWFYQKELDQTQRFEEKVKRILKRNGSEQAEREINKIVNENLEEVYKAVKLLNQQLSEEVTVAYSLF
jgi:dipeptidase